MTPNEYVYSLIIPHYNIPDLLERLLKTIPKREDLQVIVVDDCSPDESQDELRTLKEKFSNVEFYSTGTNGGGGKARNIGLSYAKGKYVLFADADDYFENNFVGLLDKYSTQEFDIVYFSAISEDEGGNNRNFDNHINRHIRKALTTQSEKDIKYNLTQPWCKIINRELIVLNGISFEESNISNDVRFSTMTDYHAKKVIVDAQQCYVWQIRSTSTSRKLNPQKILKRLEIDLIRHNFVKSIYWEDPLNYLAMINEVDQLEDKEIKNKAMILCKKYGISKKEIIIVRIKRLIRNFL